MQLNKYLNSEVTYLYQCMYVFLQADDFGRTGSINRQCDKHTHKTSLKPMNPIKAQYHAFWSAIPIGENLLRDYTYQQSNTEVASSTFPF